MARVAPCHVDAQRCPRLLPSSLLNGPGSLHHLLHRLVLTQTELMDHCGTVLDHAHLQLNKEERQCQT